MLPQPPAPPELARHRRLRRWATGLSVTATLLLAILVGIYAVLHSQWFWRHVVVSRFFGPYWDTALQWGRVEVGFLPPRVLVDELVLREPGDGGTVVARIGRLDVRCTWESSVEELDLESVTIRDVRVHLIRFEDGETNAQRAVARLFEGAAVPASGRDLPRDTRLVPNLFLRAFQFNGFEFIHEDRAAPGGTRTVTLTANRPIEALLAARAEQFVPGRLDKYLALRSGGVLAIEDSAGRIATAVEGVVTLPRLQDFPDMVGAVNLAFSPVDGGSLRLGVVASLPLDRLAIRPVAVPFADLRVSLSDGPVELASLDFLEFDPLFGNITGDMRLEIPPGGLARVATAWVGEAQTAARLGRLPAPVQSLLRESALAGHVTLQGQGVGQYAITDPAERVAPTLTTSGELRLGRVSLAGIPAVAGLWGESWARRPELPSTAEIDLDWQLVTSAAADKASGRVALTAHPTDWDPARMGVRFVVGAESPSTGTLELHPWGAAPAAAMVALLAEPTLKLPRYRYLPDFEPALERPGGIALAAAALLDALRVEPGGGVALHIEANDPRAIAALAEPFLGTTRDAGTLDLRVIAARPLDGGAERLDLAAAVGGLQLEGIPEPIALTADTRLVRTGSVLTAARLNVAMERQVPDSPLPPVLSIELSPGGLDGEAGPPRPTFFDFATGRGRAELVANTLRREILEILLRVQTFNLSGQLADPFYERLLGLLGFSPGDPNAEGQGRVFLSADLGPEIAVQSRVVMRNIPVRNLILQRAGRPAAGARFDARLFQEATLDRQSLLLRPRMFDLGLTPSGLNREFATLRLDVAEDTVLDYEALLAFTTAEVMEASEAGIGDENPLKSLVLSYFDRIKRLGRTVRGGGGRLLLNVPPTSLMPFRDLLAEAGLPLERGRLDLNLAASLHDPEVNPTTTAEGNFRLDDLRLSGMQDDLPPLWGTLRLKQTGPLLTIDPLTTALQFDGGRAPAAITFRAATRADTLESSWTLAAGPIGSDAVALLQRLDAAGLSGMARVLEVIPTARLVEIAGENGEVGLNISAHTAPGATHGQLHAHQYGRQLRVLPRFLAPLSFDLRQTIDFETRPGGAVRLVALSGDCREEGVAEPLAELDLNQPLLLTGGDPVAGDQSRVTLLAQKDLAPLADRLAELPLPLLDRSIVGGRVTALLSADIPAAPASIAMAGRPVRNMARIEASGLCFSGLHELYDATATATLDSSPGRLDLIDARLLMARAGAEVGELSVSATWAPGADLLVGDLAARMEPGLLAALPDRLAGWVRGQQARGRMALSVVAQPDAGVGDFTLEAAATGVGMPPVKLSDGEVFQHPPLDFRSAVAGSWDATTEVLLVQKMEVELTGPPVGDVAQPIAVLAQRNGGLLYHLRSWELEAQDGGDALLELALGPFDVATYKPLIVQLGRLPMAEGTLRGRAQLSPRRGADGRLTNSLAAILRWDNGVWRGQRAPERMEARVVVDGEVRGADIHVRELSVEALYPDDPARPADNLVASGTYTASPRRLDLRLSSERVAADRVLLLAGDVQSLARRYAPAAPAPGAAPAGPAVPSFFDGLAASLDARVDLLTWGALALSNARARATYEASQFRLEELLAEGAVGSLQMRGAARLGPVASPWDLAFRVRGLDSAPWVNALAPAEFRDRLAGTLDADISLRGDGLSMPDLQRSLESRGTVRLRGGMIQLPGADSLLGPEQDLALDLRLATTGNRAIFEAATPWNPWRHVILRGRIMDLIPPPEGRTTYHVQGQLIRTTPVGPRGRTMQYRGQTHPWRQDLFGATFEAAGAFQEDNSRARLENIVW